MILYLSFAIVFGVRLIDWNEDVSGHCYSTSRIALPNSKHPYVDQIYLGVTSYYVYSLLTIAMISADSLTKSLTASQLAEQ